MSRTLEHLLRIVKEDRRLVSVQLTPPLLPLFPELAVGE